MMKIAFAVNSRNSAIMPWFISMFTWSKVYHSEIIFSDDKTITAHPDGGVEFLDNIDYDYYHWIVLPLPWIDDIEERHIRKEAERIVASGAKYDYIGAVLGPIWPHMQDNNKWFCSELCAHLLYNASLTIWEDAGRGVRWFTPERIWRNLSEEISWRNKEYNHISHR